ncbi:FAD-dependent oxidoreductase [Thermodesulfobacteriota bacterium]
MKTGGYENPQNWNKEADVVIVGSGFSGLAAAVVAKELGLTVILIEKMRVPGGNSVIAGGGVNAVDPQRQERQQIIDSKDLHFKQTMEGGNHINDLEKVKEMICIIREKPLPGRVLALELPLMGTRSFW